MNTFEIKEGNSSEDLMALTPFAIIVLGMFTNFAKSRNLPILVTNVKHKFKVSKSNTHPEGRAIDISTRGWREKDITDCLYHLNEKVGYLGAYSSTTLKQRVAIHHDAGLGPHFHLQVKRN